MAPPSLIFTEFWSSPFPWNVGCTNRPLSGPGFYIRWGFLVPLAKESRSNSLEEITGNQLHLGWSPISGEPQTEEVLSKHTASTPPGKPRRWPPDRPAPRRQLTLTGTHQAASLPRQEINVSLPPPYAPQRVTETERGQFPRRLTGGKKKKATEIWADH